MRLAAFSLLVSAGLVRAAGSPACALCHPAIYESFHKTAMAASSGIAGGGAESFVKAEFTAEEQGFRYRVTRNSGTYSVEFEKIADPRIRGEKALAYFVGSGAAARSYVIAADDFLYEAPVTYYSASARWDLSPNYDRYTYPFTTRPILPGCLNCHASGVADIAGTLNRFGATPFREGGVACERCHGPGEEHIRRMQSGGAPDAAIVNPAKLDAERRDSVCAQCHLQGEVRTMRPGASWNSYQPGDRLRDSITVFVRAGTTPGMRVTSHFEKLAQSACKRASKDRLWCGSCHDPHSVPSPMERAAYFRAKCGNCHAADACTESAANRARSGDDCVGCHMPKSAVTDAEHVVYTDHSIPRRPRAAAPPPAEFALTVFGGGTAPERDLALAYAIAASRAGSGGRARAVALLERALARTPDDPELVAYLAEFYRNAGQEERAVPLYRRALRLAPGQAMAEAGLGAILFQQGDDRGAIALWRDALSRNSGLVLVATNLALAQWRIGERQEAADTLAHVLDLSPAFQPARDLLQALQRKIR